jgi:L-aspartate oxidase
LLDFNSPAVTNRELDLYDIRNSLKSLMWRAAGVKRSFAELSLAAETTQAWLRLLSSQTCDSVAGWELQNMLLVSALMIDAAKTREESRGVHFREDFPQPAEHWRRSIIYVGTQRSLSDLRTEQTLLPQT